MLLMACHTQKQHPPPLQVNVKPENTQWQENTQRQSRTADPDGTGRGRGAVWPMSFDTVGPINRCRNVTSHRNPEGRCLPTPGMKSQSPPRVLLLMILLFMLFPKIITGILETISPRWLHWVSDEYLCPRAPLPLASLCKFD